MATPRAAIAAPKTSRRTLAVLLRCFVVGGLGCGVVPVPGFAVGNVHAQSCARVDFENVVDEAGNTLRDLNRQNKPRFQDTLRQLKDVRGWDHATFLEQAKPYVSDDAIMDFDRRSSQLLQDIANLGSVNANEKTPDCAVLIELRARMTALVKTQTEKWTYMFGKLEKAMAVKQGN